MPKRKSDRKPGESWSVRLDYDIDVKVIEYLKAHPEVSYTSLFNDALRGRATPILRALAYELLEAKKEDLREYEEDVKLLEIRAKRSRRSPSSSRPTPQGFGRSELLRAQGQNHRKPDSAQ